MDAHTFVDELFAGYDQSPDLLDFKQEVLGNLTDRIDELMAGGKTKAEATSIATAELGDIGEVAAEMSQARGQDVFAQMYLRHKVRPDTAHLIGYIVCGALVLVGIALLVVTLVATRQTDNGGIGAQVAAIGIVLLALPIGALVALGTTQETTSNYPLPVGRGIGYGLGVFLVLAGLAMGGGLLANGWAQWPGMVMAVLAGLILGGGLLTFLGVTQTNRKKPWARQASQHWVEQHNGIDYADPQAWAPFGLLTVACWIIAIGLFIAIGLWLGFQYSWLVFVFALGVQFVLLARTMTQLGRTAADQAAGPRVDPS